MTEKSATADTVLRPSDEGPLRCLDEEQVLAYLDWRAGALEVRRIEAHLDGCAACRMLLAVAAEEGSLPAPDPAEKEALVQGDMVDHFRIERSLGRGGMGEVYLAWDTKLERSVALKLISPALVASEEAHQRFLVEARATARFAHPNIVAIHSVGEHADHPYLALEYLGGESLRTALDRGPLSLGRALQIAKAIAEALAEAHHHQVFHRDLKPQNILFGDDGRVRVLDFGLAKILVPDGDPMITRSAAQGIRGTPGYMAPEQWRGTDAGAPADLWALGVILYEMIAGDRPYRETSAISYALQVCEAGPAPALPVDAPVPKELRTLVGACLAKDPSARPTAQNVLVRLQRLEEDPAVKVVIELEEAAARWKDRGGRQEALWDGTRLDEAQQAIDRRGFPIAPGAARFLSASALRAHELEQRRRSRLMIAIAIAFFSAALAGGFAAIAMDGAAKARADHDRAEAESSVALIESARASVERKRHLEAKAKLRSALEISDSALARLLWWRMESDPLIWERSLGTGLFDVAVSPALDRYAAAGQDRTIRIFDTTLLSSTSLRGHGDQVMRLAFAPDGRLASSGWSGEVRLWDLAAGTSRVMVPGGERVVGLGFTHEGLVMVTTGGTVRRLTDDLERNGPAARDAAISDDSIAVASADLVLLLDPRTLQEMHAIEVPHVSAVAISSKGKLAVATEEGDVLLFDEETSKRFPVHPGLIMRLAFDQRGRVISAGQDGSVRLLEPLSGDVRVIARHEGTVWGVAAAGDAVLSGGIDRRLDLHRLDASPPPTEGHTDAVASLAFTERGVISGGYDRRVLAWSDDGESADEMLVAGGTVYGVAARKGLLATASQSGSVRLLELATGRQRASYDDHEGVVYAVAVAPDGRTVASAGGDGLVRLFTADGKGPVLAGHQGAVFDVAFAEDGRIASAGADKTVRLWNPNGKPLKVLEGHRDKVWAVAFGPQGGLISAGYDGTIRAWTLPTGESTVIGRQEGRIYSVAIDPSGSHIASAGADGAFLWTPSEGKKIRLAGHTGEVNEIRFAPDGARVAAAGDDGTVRVWNLDGSPYWWASLFDGGQLATSSGWRDARGPIDPESPWAKPARRAMIGATARTHACLVERNEHLSLWWDGPSAKWSVEVPGIRDVRALETGCVGLAKGATFYPISGAPVELMPSARAIGTDESSIIVAGDDRIARYELDGRRVEEQPYPGGAIAIARVLNKVVLGYPDGGIELAGRPRGFEGTPASRVVRLEVGPMGVLIAGFADGTLGIWDVERGVQLAASRVHGPASLIETADRRISFASELGAYGGAINTFAPDYCMLLRSVWQEVPLVWRSGVLTAAAPPENHPCAR